MTLTLIFNQTRLATQKCCVCLMPSWFLDPTPQTAVVAVSMLLQVFKHKPQPPNYSQTSPKPKLEKQKCYIKTKQTRKQIKLRQLHNEAVKVGK